jgi:hypothetical protein
MCCVNSVVWIQRSTREVARHWISGGGGSGAEPSFGMFPDW